MHAVAYGETLAEIENAFKFNDAVLRHLTVKMEAAVTGPSPMMKEEKSRSVDVNDVKEAPKGGAPAKEAAQMHCPKCGTQLVSHTLHDVSVEECPSCHGMWLDAGELEELARWENAGWVARWLRSEFRRKE